MMTVVSNTIGGEPLFETLSVKQAHESHQLTLFNFQRAEKLWTENEK